MARWNGRIENSSRLNKMWRNLIFLKCIRNVQLLFCKLCWTLVCKWFLNKWLLFYIYGHWRFHFLVHLNDCYFGRGEIMGCIADRVVSRMMRRLFILILVSFGYCPVRVNCHVIQVSFFFSFFFFFTRLTVSLFCRADFADERCYEWWETQRLKFGLRYFNRANYHTKFVTWKIFICLHLGRI